MKKAIPFVCLILSSCLIYGQTYEGTIGGNFVWLELTTNDTDNLNGQYLYRRNGGLLYLNGTKTGDHFTLTEKNTKGKTIATLNFIEFGDSLLGKWTKADKKTTLSIKLFKTDTSYRVFAKFPNATQLILADESTIDSELESNRYWNGPEEIDVTKGIKPDMNYDFVYKNMLAVSFESVEWYKFTYKNHFVFDLKTNRQVILLNEIDVNKLKGFKDTITAIVRSKLKHYIEIDLGYKYLKESSNISQEEAKKAYTDLVVEDYVYGHYYITKAGICIYVIDSLWYADTDRAGWFGEEICISYKELMPYLKNNSCLKSFNK